MEIDGRYDITKTACSQVLPVGPNVGKNIRLVYESHDP